MKKIVFVALLLGIVSLSPIDQDKFYTLRIERLLGSMHCPTYEYLSDGMFKVHYQYDATMIWDVKTVPDGLASQVPKKIIKFDLRVIDTNLYVRRFKHTATVPVGGVGMPALGAYLLKDSSIEILGTTVYRSKLFPSHIYKQNNTGSAFSLVDSLARFLRPIAFINVDEDTTEELICKPVGGLENGCFAFYKNGVGEKYPKILKYWLQGGDPTVQDPRLIDLNKNGFPELVYLDYVTVFAEYDAQTDSVKRKFHPTTTPNGGSWGIADLDNDGKKEVATGNVYGTVFFFEWSGQGDNYPIIFTEKTRLVNAYFHGEGDDLDHDGREEIFIGSEGMTAEDYVNNIAIYESVGDDQYEVSVWLDIRGVASLSSNWIKHADVDGDGEEELVVVISNACMVFKVKTDDEYELFWYKRFYASWSYVSLRVQDINNDGRSEIFIGREKWINDASDDYTEIYSFDPLSEVQKLTEIPKSLEVVTGFPNPANTTISMEFSLNEHANVSAYLLAENGKILERHQLGQLSAGTYRNAMATSHLKTGVYFYQIITEQNSISTKFVVIH